jgi:glycosyltransferase involved in cell wall biosynthesis
MKKKLNIAYLSDYPFSVSFGGKEVQMLQYYSFIKDKYSDEININFLDYWNSESLSEVDILHYFGYSNWYHDITKIIRTKFPHVKVIISPTFYIDNPRLFSILSKVFSKFIIPNYFSYKNDLFKLSDLIICNSKAEKEQLERIFPGSTPNKINILPNGIENSFVNFSDENNHDQFIRQYNIESGYLLSVSFLDERKNSINLINAFLNVAGKINKKLVLIGRNRYINSRNYNLVEKLIKANSESILYIPYIDRNSDLFKSAYLNAFAHILPSYIETPGISNIEAAAFQKPIIVGKCKPVMEYFSDNAFYVNPKSEKSISDGILTVYNTEFEVIRNKAADLQKIVQHNFTMEIISEKLIEFYQSL